MAFVSTEKFSEFLHYIYRKFLLLSAVQVMGTSLRGEMSSLLKEDQSQMQFSFIEKLAEAMRLSSAEVIK